MRESASRAETLQSLDFRCRPGAEVGVGDTYVHSLPIWQVVVRYCIRDLDGRMKNAIERQVLGCLQFMAWETEHASSCEF